VVLSGVAGRLVRAAAVAPHLRSLPDSGLAPGRVLVLCLWTLLSFWLGYMGVPVKASALLIYPLLAVGAFFLVREFASLRVLVGERRNGILASEAALLLFLCCFLCCAVTGRYQQRRKADGHGLDFVADARRLPAAGQPVCRRSAPAKLLLSRSLADCVVNDALFATPRWTYNLMCATLPALCLSTLVSLCAALTGRVRNGIVAAILILCSGTLEPLRQWFATWGSERRWPFGAEPLDYMATSRVIPFTINEYPWFTFNYADLHAHFFAMPISLLVICLAWALHGRTSEYSPQAKAQLMFMVWLCAFVLGALIVTNTWDFPMYWLLLVLCLPGVRLARHVNAAMPMSGRVTGSNVHPLNKTSSVQSTKRKGKQRAIESTSVVAPAVAESMPASDPAPVQPLPWRMIVLSLLNLLIFALFAAVPFLSRLHSEARGPQPLMQPASSPLEWLLLWGLPVAAWLWTLLVYVVLQPAASPASRKIMAFVAMVPVLLCTSIWFATGGNYLVLMLILVLLAWTALAAWRSTDVRTSFLCRMAVCGLLALLWSETTWSGFLGSPEHSGFDDFKRQDTVFKFGLQVWYLLGTAAVCGVLRSVWRSTWSNNYKTRDFTTLAVRWVRVTRWAFVLALPITFAASYVTTKARARNFEQWEGWDAWAHLQPAEREAAQWLRQRAWPNEYLIEAEQKAGGDYSEFTRYAHATGIPTVIGPQAHTFQWGVPWPKVFERKEDVRAFYTSSDKATRNRILQRYGVRYVVCGPLERQEYGPENVAR
jgi:YYY domain-containing protein